MNTRISERFCARPIEALGVLPLGGWKLKLYSITYGRKALLRPLYDAGLALAAETLPQPPVGDGRFGVGFAILHQGRTVHYLVLNWWANENEHFCRVFVRGFEDGAVWRPAGSAESSCVWDLEVIWFERNALVETVLTREVPDLEAYLRKQITVQV